MSFDINSVRSKYSDYARSYLFYCKVTSPRGMVGGDHPFLVNTTSLPAESNEAIVTNWQGMEYKMAGPSTYSEFTINFKSDPTQNLRQEFILWKEFIHDPTTNIQASPREYFGGVTITQLNPSGNPIMSYELVGAYPSAIGEISLDYGSKEIAMFDVTFTYLYHTTTTQHITAV